MPRASEIHELFESGHQCRGKMGFFIFFRLFEGVVMVLEVYEFYTCFLKLEVLHNADPAFKIRA